MAPRGCSASSIETELEPVELAVVGASNTLAIVARFVGVSRSCWRLPGRGVGAGPHVGGLHSGLVGGGRGDGGPVGGGFGSARDDGGDICDLYGIVDGGVTAAAAAILLIAPLSVLMADLAASVLAAATALRPCCYP